MDEELEHLTITNTCTPEPGQENEIKIAAQANELSEVKSDSGSDKSAKSELGSFRAKFGVLINRPGIYVIVLDQYKAGVRETFI